MNLSDRAASLEHISLSELLHQDDGPEEQQQQRDEQEGEAFRAAGRLCYVWKTVLVLVHGPFESQAGGSEYLVTIFDPVSRWIVAEPGTGDSQELAKFVAMFMFKTFCLFGFPQVLMKSGSGLPDSPCLQAGIRSEYMSLVKDSGLDVDQESPREAGQEDIESAWVCREVMSLVCHHKDWAGRLNAWLYRLRTEGTDDSLAPFVAMFGRRASEAAAAESSADCSRRRLQSSVLACRHCEETFTSKISFRIHQRRHTEEARRRGQQEGEAGPKSIFIEEDADTEHQADEGDEAAVKLTTGGKRTGHGRPGRLSRKRKLARLADRWGISRDEAVPEEKRRQVCDKAVEAVQALLAATREHSVKRGKYTKYTPELKDEIAEYALRHGRTAAAEYYSAKLNTMISESSVRNFVRTYENYSPDLREQIAKYAAEHGVELAAKYFSEKTNKEIRKGLVRAFKKQFSDNLSKTTWDHSLTGGHRIFSQALREEIGQYATQNGIAATVQLYTEKLQVPVKERTVRKFRKYYKEKEQVASSCIRLSDSSSTTIDLLHSSINVLNQAGGPYYSQPVLVHGGGGGQPQSLIMTTTNTATAQVTAGFPLSLVPAQGQQDDLAIGQQSPSSVLYLTSGECVLAPHESQREQGAGVTEQEAEAGGSEGLCRQQVQAQKDVGGGGGSSGDGGGGGGVARRKPTSRSLRGNYSQYTPELRARIGKYAVKHGNTAAIQHFQKELGHEIPESTIRGMRDKYLVVSEKKGQTVDELSGGPRGRRAILGKYDPLVQDAVRRLVKQGEKVNSFLVIATAKQVIMQEDPTQLEEYGGSIKLNPTWAKSFMKRLGLRGKNCGKSGVIQ